MKLKSIVLAGIAAMISVASFAQTADEIVSKHVEALGGADKIKAISSIKMMGSLNAGGNKLPVTIQIVDGKAFKVEFTAMGMTGYQIVTNTKGWSFMPFGGQKKAEPMTDDDVKKSQNSLDIFDDLVAYKEKGSTIESLGKDDVEGTECLKIKLTLKTGKEKTFYLASDTYLILKEVEKSTINGAEVEQSTMLSNYKKTGDVMIPYTMLVSSQGEITFTTIEINPKIDPSTFEVTAK